MATGMWVVAFESLMVTRAIIKAWPHEDPNPSAVRCEQSKHRTLAHLRACQEQWLPVVKELLARENPNVTALHPWRKFEQENYAALPWESHLAKFLQDREEWLRLHNSADPDRGGTMNRKQHTVGSLTKHLADHEAYHVNLFQEARP